MYACMYFEVCMHVGGAGAQHNFENEKRKRPPAGKTPAPLPSSPLLLRCNKPEGRVLTSQQEQKTKKQISCFNPLVFVLQYL